MLSDSLISPTRHSDIARPNTSSATVLPFPGQAMIRAQRRDMGALALDGRKVNLLFAGIVFALAAMWLIVPPTRLSPPRGLGQDLASTTTVGLASGTRSASDTR